MNQINVMPSTLRLRAQTLKHFTLQTAIRKPDLEKKPMNFDE